MGSANFNDRSMWGSRDSELAVYIEGNQDYTYYVDKRKVGVNKQIFDFRVNLFTEHFGLKMEDLAHVNSNRFWTKAWNTAYANTQIYEKVWHVYPSNQYTKFSDMDSRVDEKGKVKFNRPAFETLNQKIVGHAVVYPHNFLNEENLINRLPPAFKRVLY